MKATVALLIVIGLSYCSISPVNSNPVQSSRSLRDDLDDFWDLVPVQEIFEIFMDYIDNDDEFMVALEYMQTSDFHELVELVENMPDVMKFINYLDDSGLRIYVVLEKFHNMIGLAPLSSQKLARINQHKRRLTGGMCGFFHDVKMILPIEDIKDLYLDKLENSDEFKELIDRLQSPKLQAIIDVLVTNDEFTKIITAVAEFGVDVRAVMDFFTAILGIEFPFPRAIATRVEKFSLNRYKRELHDDLDDFLALVPKKKVVKIFLEYLQNDDEVKFVIEYIQTDDFHELVKSVEAMPDVINFYDYLHDSGLNIYDAVNKLHDYIGLPPLIPSNLIRSNQYSKRITGGVSGLIADIKIILPIEDIKDLYNYKLRHSPEFKELVERLQLAEFQEIIDALVANDEFQSIIATAKEFGVDVEAVTDLLFTLFGLEFPSRYLYSTTGINRKSYVDFSDFFAAINEDVIKVQIIDRYLQHDEEVKSIIAYMKTNNFKGLVRLIHNLDSINDVYQFLDESGVNIYPTIMKIHNYLINQRALSNEAPKTSNSGTNSRYKPTRGFNGLIDELLVSLPSGKWYYLHDQKMGNDKIYQNFINRMTSEDFKVVYKAVADDEDLQFSLDTMEENGFHIRQVIYLLKEILEGDPLGRFFSNQGSDGLHEDFEDFLLLLPVKKIVDIGMKYLATDCQVQEAVVYVKSEEFRRLIVKLQKDEQVYEVIKYFENSGATVIDLINLINEFLKLPSYPDHSSLLKNHLYASKCETNGVHEMLDEIRAVVPYAEISAMYEQKLKISKHFKYFVDRMESPELQRLVDIIVENENVLALAYQAHIRGIDINVMGKFLYDLFGLEFPNNPFGL